MHEASPSRGAVAVVQGRPRGLQLAKGLIVGVKWIQGLLHIYCSVSLRDRTLAVTGKHLRYASSNCCGRGIRVRDTGPKYIAPPLA